MYKFIYNCSWQALCNRFFYRIHAFRLNIEIKQQSLTKLIRTEL